MTDDAITILAADSGTVVGTAHAYPERPIHTRIFTVPVELEGTTAFTLDTADPGDGIPAPYDYSVSG